MSDCCFCEEPTKYAWDLTMVGILGMGKYTYCCQRHHWKLINMLMNHFIKKGTE